VARFPSPEEIDRLFEETYVDVHRRYAQSRPRMTSMLA